MSSHTEHPVPHSPSRRTAVTAAALIAVFAWVLDQATKTWVVSTMALGERIDVLPPVLYWQYHLNPGAAFSMGTDHTWLFTVIMVVVLAYVVWRARHLGGSWRWAAALGGLVGGVCGNLTDRLFRPPGFGLGEVVDFIAVPRFAIFNVADSFIVCSMIVICLLMLIGLHLDGTRVTSSESSHDDPEGHEQEDREQEELR
ncbi:MAG: signal peptidase II [Nesterenkonia sp.]|nr:signal peptidase II [Nesterenkonia sp.]